MAISENCVIQAMLVKSPMKVVAVDAAMYMCAEATQMPTIKNPNVQSWRAQKEG